jgi:hypothetical protein
MLILLLTSLSFFDVNNASVAKNVNNLTIIGEGKTTGL